MSLEILNFLPLNISRVIKELKEWRKKEVIEIRMRINQPLQVLTYNKEILPFDEKGNFIKIASKDLESSFMILSKNSIYAIERQLSEGFITIPGGHRVGFTGQAVIDNGKIKRIKNINSINYRITNEFIGTAEKLIMKIYNSRKEFIYNTLIIGPPLCGKTTFLRDLLRIVSDGSKKYGLKARKAGLVDERSEIAGAYNGVPQNKIGSRTDLLDNCPKAEGIMLLVRAMSPEVIVVDEIGREEDVIAIQEGINSGVSIITTVHGRDFQSILLRPSIKKLVSLKAFERYIVLSNRSGIGTIEKVLDLNGKEVV